MANNNQSERITKANILAVVGLVLLMVFSFLGISFKNGGEIGWALVISAAITAVAALLLWFLIKVKGKENDLEKWRKVEYATLAAYIVFAVLTTFFGGIMHFFVVNGNKEQLSNYANEDINAIEQLFTDYETYWNNSLRATQEGYENGKSQRRRCDDSLKNFIDETEDISIYIEAKKKQLTETALVNVGSEKDLHAEFNKDKEVIIEALKGWNIFMIPLKARKIIRYAENVPHFLDEYAKGVEIPKIKESHHEYKIKGYYSISFSDRNLVENLKLRKGLQEGKDFSILGLGIALLIHLLILLNYIVAYRSSSLSIRKNASDDGGIPL